VRNSGRVSTGLQLCQVCVLCGVIVVLGCTEPTSSVVGATSSPSPVVSPIVFGDRFTGLPLSALVAMSGQSTGVRFDDDGESNPWVPF
jgi:hypothetical protein